MCVCAAAARTGARLALRVQLPGSQRVSLRVPAAALGLHLQRPRVRLARLTVRRLFLLLLLLLRRRFGRPQTELDAGAGGAHRCVSAERVECARPLPTGHQRTAHCVHLRAAPARHHPGDPQSAAARLKRAQYWLTAAFLLNVVPMSLNISCKSRTGLWQCLV